jgi:hypothetical protein
LLSITIDPEQLLDNRCTLSHNLQRYKNLEMSLFHFGTSRDFFDLLSSISKQQPFSLEISSGEKSLEKSIDGEVQRLERHAPPRIDRDLRTWTSSIAGTRGRKREARRAVRATYGICAKQDERERYRGW